MGLIEPVISLDTTVQCTCNYNTCTCTVHAFVEYDCDLCTM